MYSFNFNHANFSINNCNPHQLYNLKFKSLSLVTFFFRLMFRIIILFTIVNIIY